MSLRKFIITQHTIIVNLEYYTEMINIAWHGEVERVRDRAGVTTVVGEQDRQMFQNGELQTPDK